MLTTLPAVTWSDAVPVLPPFVPVTVWLPAVVAVHDAPVHDPLGAIEKDVVDVTSPSEFSYWSRPSAVYACVLAGVIVADAGVSTRWSSGAGVTASAAELVAAPFEPVTVWAPDLVAVQTFAVQDPLGRTENVVVEVTSPSELPAASKPSAVNACDAPATIDAFAGETMMKSRLPAVTWRVAVPVAANFVPVTVCGPAEDAVQVAPVHDPFGAIENVVVEVTSPRGLS